MSVSYLQHENARPHNAQMTVDFLLNQGVEVLPWPSYSPDLNPIEHIWDELGKRLSARKRVPVNSQMLHRGP